MKSRPKKKNRRIKSFLKTALALYLIVGFLNWTLLPSDSTLAEEQIDIAESEPAPAEVTEVAEDLEVSEEVVEEAGELEARVDTGTATTGTDTVNEVNVSTVNSNAETVIASGSLGGGSVDLRGVLASSTIATSSCDACLGTTTVVNQNTATVTNTVIVEANTGGNTASSTAASTVNTGNAYAAANVVNIVNTNIVESNYLLLVLNNFGDWGGNLVFPNGDFFRSFLSLFNPGCKCAQSVSNSNTAEVNNFVSTSANSGENSAAGVVSQVQTGTALASANIYNLVNQNIYGDSSFYLLVKVFGNWSGNIFNLPEDIVFYETPDGIALFDRNHDPFNQNTQNQGKAHLNNQNSAQVSNLIWVSAQTGGNSATGTSAMIETGNAYAAANVVNIVNTNIVSSNWMAALANIFGNWSGNVSFGQPDLWVGTVADAQGRLTPGSTVNFVTTIKNNGDARASNVLLNIDPQVPYLSLHGGTQKSYEYLMPGESVEYRYSGSISGNFNPGITNVGNSTTVSLRETDANLSDNSDMIHLGVYSEATILLPHSSRTSTYPKLETTKSHSLFSSINTTGTTMVPHGGSVDYKIVVRNNGGNAFEGVLVDELTNENGKVINRQWWNLGEIVHNEEITITYTTKFKDGASGKFTNRAWVEALGGDTEAYGGALAKETYSNIASDTVMVAVQPTLPEPPVQIDTVGEILGATIENVKIEKEFNKLDLETDGDLLGAFCGVDENSKDDQKTSAAGVAFAAVSFILIMSRSGRKSLNLTLL